MALRPRLSPGVPLSRCGATIGSEYTEPSRQIGPFRTKVGALAYTEPVGHGSIHGRKRSRRPSISVYAARCRSSTFAPSAAHRPRRGGR